jgi:hypothetical protein
VLLERTPYLESRVGLEPSIDANHVFARLNASFGDGRKRAEAIALRRELCSVTVDTTTLGGRHGAKDDVP